MGQDLEKNRAVEELEKRIDDPVDLKKRPEAKGRLSDVAEGDKSATPLDQRRAKVSRVCRIRAKYSFSQHSKPPLELSRHSRAERVL